jgi:branched-chain amino acid transport system permease protein
MSQLLLLSVYGLANGAILALAALGFVLIYKASGVVNFAQGELLLIGAYAFYGARCLLHLPLALAALLSVLVAAALGALIERLVLRRLVGEAPIVLVMVTIGLSALFRALVQLGFGTAPREMPKLLPAGSVELAGAALPVDRLLAILASALVLGAFGALFRWSRHGVAMRAMADDQRAALAQGISVSRVFALAWGLAAVSALIGGVLLADITQVSQNLAGFGVLVFPVVILGGLDSVPGTILGGAIIGLASQYAEGLCPGASSIASHLLLVALLVLRPHGLLGEPRIERV